ncbi:MAG: hypothetical protein GY856_51430, partial [bacterium]|nr:hypothetical protein [bacterium]
TGPGTITAEGTTATAGARMATLTILGQGTGFDNMCTVHAEGADGFEVVLVRVIAASLMEVVYNISFDQEPTQATIVMEDGDYSYEVPFTILSPVTLENQAADQALTRGQVGSVTLSHAEAGLHFGTYFETDDSIETGAAEVIVKDTEVRIPIRVPADYPGDTLSLTANSFSEGGAYLETMSVEIDLLDPAYIAFTPSRLNLTDGEQSTGVVAQGIDLTTLESLTIEENDHVVISSWEATDTTTGAVDFVLSAETEEGRQILTADDGYRRVSGVVAFIDATGKVAYRAGRDVPAGDRVFFPVVVQGADLVEG